MATCTRNCKYHAGPDARHNMDNGCEFISFTHHSRLKVAYKTRGVWHLTKEVQELLRPENCPCFEEGKVRPLPVPGIPTMVPKDPLPKRATLHTPEKTGRKPKVFLDKERARRLYKKGLSDRLIAEKLDVTEPTVYAWRKKAGLPNIGNRTKIPGEAIRALHAEGKTDKEIAAALGLKRDQVLKYRNKHGLRLNPELYAPHPPRIDYALVERLYDAGRPDREIAAAAECSHRTIEKWRCETGRRPNKRMPR